MLAHSSVGFKSQPRWHAVVDGWLPTPRRTFEKKDKSSREPRALRTRVGARGVPVEAGDHLHCSPARQGVAAPSGQAGSRGRPESLEESCFFYFFICGKIC